MPWLGLKCPGKKLGRKKLQEAAGLRQEASSPPLPCLSACDSEPWADETSLCLTGRFGVSLGQPHSPSNPVCPHLPNPHQV